MGSVEEALMQALSVFCEWSLEDLGRMLAGNNHLSH